MLIELKTLKSDGSVLYDGHISKEELNFILNVGVNAMLNMGHLPFKKLETATEIIVPETKLIQ